MGKEGPCYHCGVTSTPLWRNGPPEKPVLCNACGSRWRTKGTLAHYTPLRVRAENSDIEINRSSRMKNDVLIKNKDVKVLKRKQTYDSADTAGGSVCYTQGSDKFLYEETSNWSSSGSAVSNSESFAQYNNDSSDLTGSAQPVVRDSALPSRKKTCMLSRPNLSPVEKLTKDLYAILQEQQSSHFTGSLEEDLLFESDRSMVSVEIGHGSVLIRHPNSLACDEESEASSLSVDNKQLSPNEAYSRLANIPEHTGNNGVNSLNIGTEKLNKPSGPEVNQKQIRDKDHREKLQMLGHHNSPLRSMDLKDILCYDEFSGQLTIDEQQQLLKYLPSVDFSASLCSLKNMFESLLFKENISAFQQLIAEGVFDNTMSRVQVEDCRTLKKLVLCNLMKSKWVEKYTSIKNVQSKRSPSETTDVSAVGRGKTVNVKKSRDGQQLKVSGGQAIIKSSERIMWKSGGAKEHFDNNNGSFSPTSLFSLPPDDGSLILNPLNYVGESCDHE